MPQTPPPDATTDTYLRRFREYVSAAIALIVMIGTITLIIVAVGVANGASADQFTRLKDLLLLVNPLLGVVIGYYFNKTSTEARAENAEATAHSANNAAQQAFQERSQALTEANDAKKQEQRAKADVNDLSQATEQYLAVAPGGKPGVLGGSGNQALDDARTKLEAALARAKNLTV